MGRAPCCDKNRVKKGTWSPQEDQMLIHFIRMNGHENWRALPKKAGLLRCGKSCRIRWVNYLRPDVKLGNFSFEEEETIIKLHQLMGNRWSAIASRLPGRTDNEIKNVWNIHLKKQVSRMGIDPVTNHSTSPSAGHIEKSPSMEKGNLDLIQAKALADSPATISNSSDTLYDSHNLSSGILSSINSIDSEDINGGSSSSLGWLESSCIDSFAGPIGYNQQPPDIEDAASNIENQYYATEISTNELMWKHSSNGEAHYFTSDYLEDDSLSCMDGAVKDPHLFKDIELQSNGDDCDGFGYWLNILKQAGSSPMLL
ncbi:hypothetical protein SUGI_1493360 [Cryptomeria japonica]|uniref:MYB transcription factor n=1 Tax=Cryptomeria japonica TaxID=3369 RepID=A0AAD3NTF9_CRYJA|nr:transcription factor MYB14-like [Cryptomeria japonica]GLJ10457.1 hypothetical protein SUGI_0128470 [Cryptomeria japonica]GLJ59131.1 hypothetical protein SUGI_1493360 [Cryptomeria japonica]